MEVRAFFIVFFGGIYLLNMYFMKYLFHWIFAARISIEMVRRGHAHKTGPMPPAMMLPARWATEGAPFAEILFLPRFVVELFPRMATPYPFSFVRLRFFESIYFSCNLIDSRGRYPKNRNSVGLKNIYIYSIGYWVFYLMTSTYLKG